MAQSTATADSVMKDSTVDTPPGKSASKRVAQFDYYWDVRNFTYKLRKSVKQPKEAEKVSKYAIVIRRNIDTRGVHRSTDIIIKSALLRDVLLDINKEVEDTGLIRTDPIIKEEHMYHSYSALVQRLILEEEQENRNEALIRDIQAGIFYVDHHLGTKMQDINQMISKGEISYDTLWALFIPNTLVYARHSGTDQDILFIVRSSSYEERQDRTEYLNLACDVIQDDGHKFGFAREYHEINKFTGTRSITSLEFYPLKYHEKGDTIYTQAVEFGKHLVQLPTHCFREVCGRATRTEPVNSNDSDSSGNVLKRQTVLVNGRVMFSPSAYTRFHAGISPVVDRPLPSKEGLTNDQLAVCSPIGRGYAINHKIWGEFAMTRARNIDWNDSAFEALVLGQRQKALIETLVLQHAKWASGFDDIIQGKGRGIIGLLSGTPGCGKTLTAEAVAEVTHKPLYSITAGELGITPESVEKALNDAFELGEMWDAVVLLDEAEVFLAQRTSTDVERNALVSIFLRRLEYYQGILILTTNLPKNFDHAFQSRIHFSMAYPELDPDSRKKIWNTFFKRSNMHISDDQLSRLASFHLNGRQIKNAFSSAKTVNEASNSPSPISFLDDLDTVLEVLNEWNLQLKET